MNRFIPHKITPLQRLALWLAGCALVFIFAFASVGFDPSLSQFSAPATAPPSNTSVDQSAYTTARNLAALAATPQEQQYAVLAMRAADHELDQSFASAVRDASSHRVILPPGAETAFHRSGELKQAIREDEVRIAALNTEAAETSEDHGERLRLAEAQLALDQDEQDDVEQDLTRLGGNQQSAIQQAFDQHRSIEAQAAALPKNAGTAALETPASLHSVVGKARTLSSLKERHNALADAGGKALDAQRKLQQQHDAMAAQSEVRPGAKASALGASSLAHLDALSEREKDLADLDKRAHDLGQLAIVYGDWSRLIESQRRSLQFALAADFLKMVMALLGTFALSGLAHYLIRRWERARSYRLNHVRVVVTLILEVIVVARIAAVIFGMPGNVSTVIGFITAGLTVTLRDFLVSFVGWFALMGKRGIQVGDWVEIDGTQGEVVEITALYTFLLETGNWATSGQFTGRQVVFMNKFAVERKYFNFSTPEQWLWDELIIPVPASKQIDPSLLDQLQELILAETDHAVELAEASWREIVASHGLPERKATPTVVVRTSASGLEVVVRYAAKAPTRFHTAVRLRQSILSELHLGAGMLRTEPKANGSSGESLERLGT